MGRVQELARRPCALDDDQRLIIVRGLAADEFRQGLGDQVHQVCCWLPGMVGDQTGQPLFAELGASGVQRFGDAVGEEDDHVVGRERQLVLGQPDLRDGSQRDPAPRQRSNLARGVAVKERREMAGVAVRNHVAVRL